MFPFSNKKNMYGVEVSDEEKIELEMIALRNKDTWNKMTDEEKRGVIKVTVNEIRESKRINKVL